MGRVSTPECVQKVYLHTILPLSNPLPSSRPTSRTPRHHHRQRAGYKQSAARWMVIRHLGLEVRGLWRSLGRVQRRRSRELWEDKFVGNLASSA